MEKVLTKSAEIIKDFLLENEFHLLEFEKALVSTIRNEDVEVMMVKDLKNQGCFVHKLDDKTGKTYDYRIMLPAHMLERKNGVDQALARIITMSHEFGHFLDLREYYHDGIDFREQDEIIKEQDAWNIAYLTLDSFDFDRFGYHGWRAFRMVMVAGLASYYYALNYGGDREEFQEDKYKLARKEAIQFANLLLQSKAEIFKQEADTFKEATK